MIVVDSSVWIDHFNGKQTPAVGRLEQLLGKSELLIGDLILCEVLQGFRTQRDHDRALELLSWLEYADMLGRDLALLSADTYRRLRRRGVTVRSTIDVMIATFCVWNDHALLYSDRDFDPMCEHLGLVVA